MDYFVQCDNYAGSLYGRAVTVECVDRYGMKLISKVFVKMCAAKTLASPFSSSSGDDDEGKRACAGG